MSNKTKEKKTTSILRERNQKIMLHLEEISRQNTIMETESRSMNCWVWIWEYILTENKYITKFLRRYKSIESEESINLRSCSQKIINRTVSDR